MSSHLVESGRRWRRKLRRLGSLSRETLIKLASALGLPAAEVLRRAGL
jgi:hypothetical protein